MILLAVMAIIALLALPRLTRARVPHGRISCVNHLKLVGLAFRQWSMDHGDKYPMAVSTARGGTKCHPLAYEPWVHFQLLSNELNTPKVLVCPDDRQVVAARDFGMRFGKANVSYFVSLDAEEERGALILSGDRNLTSKGVAMKAGLQVVDGSATMGWTKAIHNRHGNIGPADGSVRQVSNAGLQQYLRDNPQTNRLAIP